MAALNQEIGKSSQLTFTVSETLQAVSIPNFPLLSFPEHAYPKAVERVHKPVLHSEPL